jgi:hypothetical protein
VPNWPAASSSGTLLAPTKVCAMWTMVACIDASPWWYAVCSAQNLGRMEGGDVVVVVVVSMRKVFFSLSCTTQVSVEKAIDRYLRDSL